MTRSQQLTIAWAAFVGALVMVWVSKTRTGDIAMIIVAVTAAGYMIGTTMRRAAARRSIADDLRQEARAPWEMFSEPHSTDMTKWEVGLRRVRDDGRVLDRRVLKVLDEWDTIEIEIAKSDAKGKVQRWNRDRVGH